MTKSTITVDDEVDKGLHARGGHGNISCFLNDMARTHVVADNIKAGYFAMAADGEREQEALEWSEQGAADLNHDQT